MFELNSNSFGNTPFRRDPIWTLTLPLLLMNRPTVGCLLYDKGMTAILVSYPSIHYGIPVCITFLHLRWQQPELIIKTDLVLARFKAPPFYRKFIREAIFFKGV
jgi:hypothetical protein